MDQILAYRDKNGVYVGRNILHEKTPHVYGMDAVQDRVRELTYVEDSNNISVLRNINPENRKECLKYMRDGFMEKKCWAKLVKEAGNNASQKITNNLANPESQWKWREHLDGTRRLTLAEIQEIEAEARQKMVETGQETRLTPEEITEVDEILNNMWVSITGGTGS